jgi:NhaA family Na+:H+ antiporter
MATDIAFALGILSLLGPRVPLGLKVFLTALAIVDDLGAVLVIALFYTSELAVWWLVSGIGLVVVLAAVNRLGVRRLPVYALVGVVVWYCFLKSGVHATIAGVALAMTIPNSIKVESRTFSAVVARALDFLQGKDDREHSEMERRDVALEAIGAAADRYSSPLHRLEQQLAPWVAFVIMPVFALANAGVVIDPAQLAEAPAGRAIAGGLVIGKTVGISLFAFAAVKLGLCVLPRGVSWSAIVGAAALGGIGFTMSLFIAALAYPDPTLLASAKMGILGGSLISGLLGAAVLGIRLRASDA